MTFLVKLHIITIQFGLSSPNFNFSPFCLMLDTGDQEIWRPAMIPLSLLFYVLKWCLLQLAFSLRRAISQLLCWGEVFLNSLLCIAPSSVVFFWRCSHFIKYTKQYWRVVSVWFIISIFMLSLFAFFDPGSSAGCMHNTGSDLTICFRFSLGCVCVLCSIICLCNRELFSIYWCIFIFFPFHFVFIFFPSCSLFFLPDLSHMKM